MSTRLTQVAFDTAAAAWVAFIDSATPEQVQALFEFKADKVTYYQTFVSFDLATTIPLLLSTVGIARIAARFVLVPPAPAGGPVPTPRFRVVLYATDQLGGRISAYYQGDTDYHVIPPKPTPTPKPGLTPPVTQDDADPAQGLVPFSLIRNWLKAWVTAAMQQQHQHLRPAMFATSSYGPLQGYTFEVGDFMDQLFLAPGYSQTQLYLNFGLKTYFPAFPEAQAEPAQTFGLVVRLYTPPTETDGTHTYILLKDVDAATGTESGPSYDLAQASPPA